MQEVDTTFRMLPGLGVSLRQLRMFVVLAESSTITQAAERIGITQQGLSSAVARLEDELGVRLLERGRRATLTVHGQLLAASAHRILHEADEMLARLAALGDCALTDGAPFAEMDEHASTRLFRRLGEPTATGGSGMP